MSQEPFCCLLKNKIGINHDLKLTLNYSFSMATTYHQKASIHVLCIT